MGKKAGSARRRTTFRVDTIAYDDAELDWSYVECPWDFISGSHAKATEQFAAMRQETAYGALKLAREQFPEMGIDGIEFNLNEVDDDGVNTLESRDFPIELLETQ